MLLSLVWVAICLALIAIQKRKDFVKCYMTRVGFAIGIVLWMSLMYLEDSIGLDFKNPEHIFAYRNDNLVAKIFKLIF